MCHEDEAVAIERGIDGAHFFGYSLAHYYVFGEHRPGATSIWEEFEANRDARGFARSIVTPDQAPLGVKLLQEGLGSLRGAVGTPDQIADLVSRYEAAGVDQVIFVSQAGKNRHEHICEAISLVGEKVLPRFARAAEGHEAEKRARLAEACERALARRAPARSAPEGYVISPGDEPRPAYSSGVGGASGGGGGARGDGSAGSLGDRARQLAEGAFASFVRGRSDDQLDRLMGTNAALRVLFKGMESAYVPSAAQGFAGEILYDLVGDRGPRPWTVSIDSQHAVAEPRGADAPAVTLRARVPVFVRIAAGQLDPARAMFEGALEIEGDFAVAARLGDMFGQPPRF
jgi:hypothetical protein